MKAVLLAALLALACVSTQTTAVESAAYEGATFRGILVEVPTNDLTKRQHYENAMVSELTSHNIRAVSALSLFPPMDAFTPEQTAQAMAQHGLDTVLWILPAGETHQTDVVGHQTNVQMYTYGSASTVGTTTTGSATTTGTATTTDITRTTHTAALEARLVDFSTNKTVWMAQSQGQGSAKGAMGRMGVGSDVVEHIAADIGTKIAETKLFTPK